MICIFCSSETKVSNSRSKAKAASTWRRRQCLNCGSIFSTTERPNFATSIKVRSGSGKFKPFSEDKLFISIYECLSHRKDSLAASKSLLNTILEKTVPAPESEVTTEQIAKQAYTILKRYDKPSALIYKARHPIF